MQTNSIADIVPSRLRAIGGIGVLTVAMLAGTAGAASAASVTPTPINDGNPTCGDFNADWSELKVEDLGDGIFTDGTLEITISNFQNSNSGTPGSFDWSSNIGVDAVFVKAGNDKHNLFVYEPESKGDTDLGPQAGNGNGISHISFCYDDDPPADEPPADEPPADEPPADEPPADEPPADEPPNTPDEPTPSPTGEVLGVSGTPKPTLPPTDALASDAGSAGSALPAFMVILTLVTISGIVTVRMPTRRRR